MKIPTTNSEITSDQSPDSSPPPPMSGNLMRGTAWMVAMRWCMRGSGLVSTAVLARLLTPEDFGLVAIAMSMIALAEVLTNFGVETALLRNKHAGDEHLNTAWTVRQIQLFAVAGTIILLAPLAADFFRDDRLTDVMRLAALGIAVRGIENTGIINFRRHLQFGKDFRFNLLSKITGVIVTIALAFLFRSYWALLFGMLANAIIAVLLSYVMCEYRPRWSLATWQELWGFSQWMLVRGLADFIFRRGDVFVLGRVGTPELLGNYTVAQEIAHLPTSEISMPVSRALVPGFAQLVDEPDRLKSAFLKSIAALTTCGLPASLGLVLVADEIVPLLLGEQWFDAISLLKVFAAFSLFGIWGGVTGNLVIVMGHVRFSAIVMWTQAAVFVALAVPIFHLHGALGVVWIKGLVGVGGCAAYLTIALRSSKASWRDLFAGVWRPVLAGAAMWAGLYFLSDLPVLVAWSESDAYLFLLLTKTFFGAFLYAGILLLLWNFTGRPDGLERVVLQRISTLYR